MEYKTIATKYKEGNCMLKIYINDKQKFRISTSKDDFSKEILLQIYKELYVDKTGGPG